MPDKQLHCGPYTVIARDPGNIGRWAAAWRNAHTLVADAGTLGGLHDSPAAAFDALAAAGWTVHRTDQSTATVHRTGCPLPYTPCTGRCRGPEPKPWQAVSR